MPAGTAPRVGGSKVGGSPDLADDEAWPLNERGVPLAFAAQLDCRELPEIAPEWRARLRPWQHGGQLLRFFTDALDDWELGRATGPCDPGDLLRPTPAPSQPRPWPAGGANDELEPAERAKLYMLPETAICFEPFLSAPETHPRLRPQLHQFDDVAERYGQWAYRLRIDSAPNNEETATTPWEVHHVPGEATSVQDDVRSVGWMLHDDDDWGHKRHGPCNPALVDLDAWQVLLALHMDQGLRLDLHDGGALHLLVPVADLATGRLDRVQYVIASG